MHPPVPPALSAPLVEVSTAELVPYFAWLDSNDVLTLICGILLLRLAAQTLRRGETDDGPSGYDPPRDGTILRLRTRPDCTPEHGREPVRRVTVWRWLRLALGVLQMTLSLVGAVALCTVGLRPLTWGLVAGATAASGLRWWLYRIRPFNDPAE
jgi:hypothetical protein